MPDSSTRFQVEIFEPMPAQGVNLLNLAKSDVMQHLYPSAGVFFQIDKDPFQLVRQDDTDVVVSHLVKSQATLSLWGAVGLFDLVDIGIVMPLVVSQSGAGLALFNLPNGQVDGFVLGDMRLIPKIRPFNPEDAGGFGLAFTIPLYLPTGDSESFNSYGKLRALPTLVVDWRDVDSGFAIAANVGYMLQPEAHAHNLVMDDGLHLGLGLEIPLGRPEVKLVTSLFGVLPSSENRDPADLTKTLSDLRTTPIEIDGALQIRLGPVVLELGAGAGLTQGVGAPDVRGFASVGDTPVTRDRDKDGILDRNDDCPDDPEDKDNFQDQDGCPEPDNDKDGILDVVDGQKDLLGFGACRNDPEDKDGHEDQDGCPDPDNDGDGIADVVDGKADAMGFGTCRDEPEDKDAFEDQDGCPDYDNDQDGILDAADGPVDASGYGSCRNDPRTTTATTTSTAAPTPTTTATASSTWPTGPRTPPASARAATSRRPRTSTSTTTAAPTRRRRRCASPPSRSRSSTRSSSNTTRPSSSR
ncbi:MAG: transporter [Myxococcota bacterium]